MATILSWPFFCNLVGQSVSAAIFSENNFSVEKLKIAGKSRKVGVFITSGGSCILASQQIQGLQSSALKTRRNGLAGVRQGVSQGAAAAERW